jgi:hypothetical protein
VHPQALRNFDYILRAAHSRRALKEIRNLPCLKAGIFFPAQRQAGLAAAGANEHQFKSGAALPI